MIEKGNCILSKVVLRFRDIKWSEKKIKRIITLGSLEDCENEGDLKTICLVVSKIDEDVES